MEASLLPLALWAGASVASPSTRSMPLRLEQAADAARERLDDLRAARLHRGVVDLDARDRQAEVAGLADLAEQVRRAQHGLGGDARVVEAASADLVALDHGGLLAELGGADRGHVPAWTRADHDAVVGGLRHLGRAYRSVRSTAWILPITRTSFQNSQPARPMLSAHTTAATIVEATTRASEVTRIWKASSPSKPSTAQ